MDIDDVLEQYSQGRRDFHGINLSETDLSGLNLSGIDLREADFSESDLISTNLSLANLNGCNFSQADLSNANLIGADFSNASLFLARLHGSKIDKTTKINSKWALVWEIVNKGAEKQNLNGIDLSGANLSDANLSCADLSGADLCSANLSSANLNGANLSNTNLECADLSDAELSDANLSGASLINTDLTGTNLKNIDLSSVHIEIRVDNPFMSNNDIFYLERQFYEKFEVYKKVEGDGIPLEGLAWRELEKLVAELLSHENYEVFLGKGSKDDGADVIAVREIENIGFFKTIWQVKHSQKGRKVSIEVIRQLADTRNELKASKGIIVTNSFLTREALSRIDRDKFTLGKIDRDDLTKWIEKSQPKYKSFLGLFLN